MRQKKATESEFKIAGESTTITWVLAETQRHAEERETFRVEKGKSQVGPDWRLLARETRSEAFYVINYGCIFGFFWLVQSWKQG